MGTPHPPSSAGLAYQYDIPEPRSQMPLGRVNIDMPTKEWTGDEADPYQAPDDPDNWRDESEE